LPTDSNNRRQDTRFSAPFANVKIRRRGFGIHRWNTDSTLIDVSSSGISVSSRSLRLNTLNKVEFELSIDGKNIAGSAIVCYTTRQGSDNKYGLLFIQANTGVEQLLSDRSFSTDQAKRLGVKLAEQFIQQRTASSSHRELKRQHQLMLDAIKAMASRLGEMGLLIKTETGNYTTPDQALTLGTKGELGFPSLSPSNQITRLTATTVEVPGSQETDPVFGYQLSSGEQFNSLVDLLEYLYASFEKIAAPV
jgi:hypothetical protein